MKRVIKWTLVVTGTLAIMAILVGLIFLTVKLNDSNTQNKKEIVNLQKKIFELENEDQRQTNLKLSETQSQVQKSYKESISAYEKLLDLKLLVKDTKKFDEVYGQIVKMLAEYNYASASALINQFSKDVEAAKPTPAPVQAVAVAATGGQGYSRQTVKTEKGDFVVSMIGGDLSNTKVIIDTASDNDCGNNCPVLPLATYVARNGAYAGVNGSYFCPATYPTCAGKTNSFDLLVMNKNKHYFNSDNNVYSNNPGVIFGGGYVRFVSAVSQWGRDTSIDGMLSNFPLLVQNGNIVFGGNDDPKQVSRGNRSFVANKGNAVYIGVAYNVSVIESAYVMKSLGMDNAMNLDSGGSTALWSGGYVLGPGRDLPNVILFVRK